jgi:integrase
MAHIIERKDRFDVVAYDGLDRSPAGKPMAPRRPRPPRCRSDGRPHRTRHTHASLLIMDGVPVKVLSERLGHANVAFTIHTYQHLLPGMSASAAQQFAARTR